MEAKRRAIYRHVRAFVYARDGTTCVLCGTAPGTHMDHVVPLSRGGSDGSDNLRPTCPLCNLSRGVRDTDDDGTTRLPVALTCTTCAPESSADHLGFCYSCRAVAPVAEDQIDRCPDPRSCDCRYTPRGRRLLAEQGHAVGRPGRNGTATPRRTRPRRRRRRR